MAPPSHECPQLLELLPPGWRLTCRIGVGFSCEAPKIPAFLAESWGWTSPCATTARVHTMSVAAA